MLREGVINDARAAAVATLGFLMDGNPSMMRHSIQLAGSSFTSYASVAGWAGSWFCCS